MRKISLVLFILVSFALSACAAPATEAPAADITDLPAVLPSALPAASETMLETTDVEPARKQFGQMELAYPSSILAGSSKTVELAISIPDELASANAEEFVRENITSELALPTGYKNHVANIYINEMMRAEMVAPGFKVEALYPESQVVDLQGGPATHWGWIITAPQTVTEQVVAIRLYLGDDTAPCWVGTFDVLVTEPATATASPSPEPTLTPTITPTPTPVPMGQRISEALVENAPEVLGTILTTIIAAAGLYLQYKNKDKKK